MKWLIVVVFAVSLLLTACSSGGDASEAVATPEATPTLPPVEYEIVTLDHWVGEGILLTPYMTIEQSPWIISWMWEPYADADFTIALCWSDEPTEHIVKADSAGTGMVEIEGTGECFLIILGSGHWGVSVQIEMPKAP